MSKALLKIVGITTFLAVLFCAGFVFFYGKLQQPQSEAADSSKSFINKPLPAAHLVDMAGANVDEQVRKGRVVLVFVTPECQACLVEGEFLKTLLDRRRDVTFFGVVPFGKTIESEQASKKLFPFQVFYDDGDSLVQAIGINRVPVKIFLEDGIIKKGWIGAALSDRARMSFTEWLDGLE
jgi:Redoxin